jgi:hypothetical protein
VWTLVKPKSPLTVTVGGARVDGLAATLDTADRQFASFAHDNWGAVSTRSHCFLQRVGGTLATDVSTMLRCGPALFFGASPSATYVSYAMTAATQPHGHVTLAVGPEPVSADPAAPPDTSTLERPDHKRASATADGVVPLLPPATTAAFLEPVPDAEMAGLPRMAQGLRIIGRDVAVTESASGVVSGLGRGPNERRAPDGSKLFAFQLDVGAGEVTSAHAPAVLDVGMSIDGAAASPLRLSGHPNPNGEYFVAAVPTAASAIELVLKDAGATQTMSLITGGPASGYHILSRRNNLFAVVNASGTATASVDAKGHVFSTPLDISTTSAWLEFYSSYDAAHASGPNRALLTVGLCYRGTAFVDSTTCRAFRGTDLTITADGGAPIKGFNAAPAGANYADPVFDVPATFTGGTITVTGSEASTDGWSMTITRPWSFVVSIPPG